MKQLSFKKIGLLSLLITFLSLLSLRPSLEQSSENYTGGLHFITFKQLVGYISEFRNNENSHSLNKLTQGGYVDARVIDSLITAGAQGIVFHYCVDSTGTGVPFLAFQSCADSSNNAIGNNDVLHLSFDEHTSTNSTSSAITAELLADTLAISGQDVTATGSVIRDYKGTFNITFGSGNVSQANGYINGQEMLSMINENGSRYLHYFWGYDETESVNKLRLCFVGFNANGKINYILDTNTQSYYSFLERSWP